MVKQCTANKKPVLIALKRQTTAINNHFCAVRFALIDITNNAVFCLLGDHWAHFNARFVKLANFQSSDLWRQFVNKPIGRVITNCQNRRYRHTAFTGRPIGRAHSRIHRLCHVGIRHDDHMIFCPTQCLYTFAIGASSAVNIFANSS